MKYNIHNKNEFVPFSIEVNFESRRDVEAFLCIMNASYNNMAKFLNENWYGDSDEKIRFDPTETSAKNFQGGINFSKLREYIKFQEQ